MNLFLLISTVDHETLEHLHPMLSRLLFVKEEKPYFKSCADQTKVGGGQTIATYSISSVCECVTETDICLTFYAGLNDKQERGS